MRHTRNLLAALAALAVVLVAAAPSSAIATTTTPFRSEAHLQATFAVTAVPGVFFVTTSGVGHASHLGRVTVGTTETLDLTSPAGVVVRDGRMVMVAANGDELHWSYEGSASPPDEDGTSEITGTFVITGGTGRFSDATGSGTVEGFGNAVTGVVSVSYRGTVAYQPGENRGRP